jgi:hypothetical protein
MKLFYFISKIARLAAEFLYNIKQFDRIIKIAKKKSEFIRMKRVCTKRSARALVENKFTLHT